MTSLLSTAQGRWLARLLPWLAGLAQALSIASPWNGQPLWWLQLVSLALLVWLLDRERADADPRAWLRAGYSAWAFATAWLCGATWWMYVSMHTYGGLAAPLAALAVFLLSAALSLYYGLAGALYARWAPRRLLPSALLFAALWTMAELLRNSLFTGFPWGAGGYAHLDGPLIVFARSVGVYGIGALAAIIAVLLARVPALNPRRAKSWIVPAALAAFLVYGGVASNCLRTECRPQASMGSAGPIDVALLQGNIPQDEKFIPGGGVATALRWYGEQLMANRAPLVITPETAIPLLPSQLPPGYLDAIAKRYASGEQAAIVGLPLGDGRDYTNSVLGFAPGLAQPYRYDKAHLVPFGEFVPSMFRWFTNMMNIPLGDFRSGGLAQPAFQWKGQRIAPNICYEDLFGDEIGANFRDEANAPTVLLNVSNIAWFGDTIAIDQHKAISRMRAIEFERPMVRATNTGATVVIDHRGRVTHELPRMTRGVLTAQVEGRTGLTPYARWVAKYGLWPIWVGALSIVAATLAGRLRARRLRQASRAASPD
ncbi:apolipoprotein N-acyltransferase [Variovorax sp. OV329]|uniref:apolipoprotein N-acyltransferase n=1 Tax=Variovorax sp. OV329 TaxID=1882825 RepID=UPI0008F29F13|nr:apolipoprotein N-acyltransferase [Variovorax sp. OV329]SFN24928.1 apolipoprotein N-acyltransferase [Variovorax sp. OV329]